jgi:hypothetical protein
VDDGGIILKKASKTKTARKRIPCRLCFFGRRDALGNPLGNIPEKTRNIVPEMRANRRRGGRLF